MWRWMKKNRWLALGLVAVMLFTLLPTNLNWADVAIGEPERASSETRPTEDEKSEEATTEAVTTEVTTETTATESVSTEAGQITEAVTEDNSAANTQAAAGADNQNGTEQAATEEKTTSEMTGETTSPIVNNVEGVKKNTKRNKTTSISNIGAGVSTIANQFQLNVDNSTILVNNKELKDGDVVTNGDSIEVKIEFSMDNTNTDRNPNNEYVYDLNANSKGLEFSDVSGDVKVGGRSVGKYRVEGGKLIIQITDQNELNKSNLQGNVTLDGKINIDSKDIVDGNKGKVSFKGKECNVTVQERNPGQSQLNVQKSRGAKQILEDGTIVQQFTITVNSYLKNTEINISDIAGDYLKLTNNVTVLPEKYQSAVHITEKGNSFDCTIDSMEDGDTVTLTYTMEIDKKAYADDSSTDQYTNKYIYKYKNNQNKEIEQESGWVPTADVSKPQINKNGIYDKDSKKVKWTITIWGNDLDLNGANLSDKLGEHLKCDDSESVTVKLSFPNEWQTTDLTTTFGKLKDNYRIQDDSGRVVSGVTITYETEVSADYINSFKDNTVYNYVSVKIDDNEYKDIQGQAIIGKTELLQKSCQTADGTLERESDDKQILEWKSTITVPVGGLKNLIYTDTIAAGHELIQGSIKIEGITPAPEPTVTSNSGFSINFDEGTSVTSGEIIITYKTKCTDVATRGMTATYRNDAEIQFNDDTTITQTATDNYNYRKKNVLKKYNYVVNNTPKAKAGELNWLLEVDLSKVDYSKDLVITDTLSEGMEYKDNTLKYDCSGQWNYDNFLSPTDWTITKSDLNLTITIPADFLQQVKDHNQLYIQYTSTYSNLQDMLQQTNVMEVKNEAKAKQKGSDEVIGDATASGWVSPLNDLLTKTAEYTTYTHPDVNYKIEFNKDKLDILPGDDKIKLIDEMGSALALNLSSFDIYEEDGVTKLDKSQYTLEYEIDVKGENVITLTVPDERYLIIRYSARLNLPEGTALNDNKETINQVWIEGEFSDESRSSKGLTGNVLKSRAEITNNNGSLTLWKYNQNIMNTLSNAVFEVAMINYDEKTKTWEYADPNKVEGYNGPKRITSSEEGNAYIDELLYDNIYEIKEIYAPKGYKQDNVSYWFILSSDGGYSKQLPNPLPSGVKELKTDGTAAYFPNERADGAFDIGKKDESGNYLSGATLKLYDANNKEVLTIKTKGVPTTINVVEKNADSNKNEILPGKYTLVEEETPDGYKEAKAITFKVDQKGTVTEVENGTFDNGELVMVDAADEDAAEIKIVKKKSSLKGDILSGAVLTLMGEDGTEVTITTSTKPTTVKGLKKNTTYTLSETETPYGYEKAKDIVFSIDDNGKIKESGDSSIYLDSENNVVTMVDMRKNTTIYISKQSINGTDELKGANLEVRKKGETGSLISWTSDEKPHSITVSLNGGSANKTALVPGDYVLVETTAPDGYGYSESIEFTITEDGKVLVGGGTATDIVVMKDKPLSIHIDKRDMSTGDPIRGAKFELKDKDDVLIEKWESLGNIHEIKGTKTSEGKTLKTGMTYTLTETQAPQSTEGRQYDAMAPVKFRIENDGSLTILEGRLGEDVYLNSNNNLVLYNIPVSPGNFYISKRDAAGKLKEEIEGVQFTLTDLSDTGLKEQNASEWVDHIGWTTGAIPTTFWVFNTKDVADKFKAPDGTYKLISGHKYRLKEENTVFGYEKATDAWEFTVALTEVQETQKGYVRFNDMTASDFIDDILRRDDGDNNTTYDIRVLNKSMDVSISKQSLAGEEVPGATLKIYKYDENGNVIKEIQWVSEDTPHNISLSELGYGKFKLEEIAAPSGYAYAESIDFNINDKGIYIGNEEIDGSTITMTDAGIENVAVSKKAVSEEDELPGASITLYEVDSNGKETAIESWTSGTEPHVIDGTKLKAGGTYKLHENAAPAGYQVTTDIMFVVDKDGTVKMSSVNTNSDASINADDREIVIRDKAIDNIYISKKAISGADELPGAEITLYEIDDKGNETIIDSWTSGTTPHEIDGKDLKAGGKYKLHEETAPDGYQVTTDIFFEIGPDGSIQMSSANTNGDAEINTDGRQIVIRDRTDAEEEEEEEEQEEEETDTKTAKKTDSKKTGDSAPIPLAGTLFFLSLAGAGTAYGLRRKKARKK